MENKDIIKDVRSESRTKQHTIKAVVGHLCCLMGLPRWLSGKEHACQCRRHKKCELYPWVGKIPWRKKW